MKRMEITDDIIYDISQLLMTAADETRLRILLVLLQNKKLCVSDIQQNVGASQSLVSHQLSILRKMKLVASDREGNKVFYFLDDDHVNKLIKVAYEHVMEERHE